MIMGERADPTHNLIKFGGFSHPAGKLTLYHRSKSPPPPVEDQEDAHWPQKHLRFETNVGLNNLQWLHHDLYHFPGMVEKFHIFSFLCCFLIHFSIFPGWQIARKIWLPRQIQHPQVPPVPIPPVLL